MSTLKSSWTTLSYFYNKYLYTKMAGFFLWLIVSSMIFMTTTEGILQPATPSEIAAYMLSVQLLGLLMTFVILFIPRLLLRMPIAFGLFDEKY